MAFGIDDLINWADGLRKTFSGGTENGPNAVGNQNVQDAIVNPLKIGSEYSGVTQGYRGAKPNASTKDQGLALLALTGMLGTFGVADDVTKLGAKVGGKAQDLNKTLNPINKMKSGKYIYGLHFSPQANLPVINSANPNAAKLWDDSVDGANYFFNMDSLDRTKMMKMLEYVKMYGNSGKGKTGSMYMVRAPRKGSFTDLNDLFRGSRDEQINNLFEEFLQGTKKPLMRAEDYLDKTKFWGKRDPFTDGQMFSKSPLKVMKEFPLERGINIEDLGFLEHGSLDLRKFYGVDPKMFYKALKDFNKKNPGAKQYNESWIKAFEKKAAQSGYSGTRQPFHSFEQADIKDLERYNELGSKIDALKKWVKENTGGRGIYKEDYNKVVGDNPALRLGDEFPDDVLLRPYFIGNQTAANVSGKKVVVKSPKK